jgi:hypothetical protein
MQFSTVAILALAAGASAWKNETASYTTVFYTDYTTVCPEATVVTAGSHVITVTAATTLTIESCSCTVVHPVSVTSSVAVATSAPVVAPVYTNATVATTVATTAAGVPTKSAVGTTSAVGTATPTPSTITASGANKVFALSGASLAGLLGLAAYIL